MKDNEFKCASCLEVFEKAWTYEEAKAEQIENGWGNCSDEDMVVVCDDCYKQLMDKQELVNKTTKKIADMDAIDFKMAISDLEDYPEFEKDILYSIHNKDHDDIGKSLMIYLYHHAERKVIGGE